MSSICYWYISKMDWRPKRGDVVEYKGTLYFFQPNGTSCNLYKYRDRVGFIAQRVCDASRRSITRPDKAAAQRYARIHQFAPREHLADFVPCVIDFDNDINLSEESENSDLFFND